MGDLYKYMHSFSLKASVWFISDKKFNAYLLFSIRGLSYFQPLTISNVEHGGQTEEKARFCVTIMLPRSKTDPRVRRQHFAITSETYFSQATILHRKEVRSAEGLALIYVWQAFFPAFD